MAAIDLARIDVERIAETQQQVHNLHLELIAIDQRLSRQDVKTNAAMLIAVVAGVGGTLFGVVNFVLLLQLLARLH